MFKRVLIANRGEIAVRVIRACQELGIETVAIYSDADADALHVQLADMSVRVGAEDAMDSYLNKENVLNAAIAAEADAIHPGYGFLSEDADFAQSVTEAGITWIGPNPETIRLVGDKDAARASMVPSGIPMSPGSTPLTDNDDAIAKAKEVTYPVILKPVAGGGGKGMFVAHDETELKRPSRSSTSRRCAITSSTTSSVPATSRCRSWPITTARCCISANASAPSSAATRSS